MISKQIKLFKEILINDLFINNYTIAISIAIVIDWLMISYFTKAMGMYVPLYIISMYYIVGELAGYTEPYFKKVTTATTFLILIVLDTAQLMVIFISFYDDVLFTYLLMIIFSLQAILYEIYSIKTAQYIENYVDKYRVSEVLSVLLFNRSNMIITGLLLSVVYSLIFQTYDMLFTFIIVLMTVSIYYEYKLYSYIKVNKII